MKPFSKISEEIRNIKINIDSIKEDAQNGEIKTPSSFKSPILMNPHDFMTNDPSNTNPIDIYSENGNEVIRRDNYYSYYQAIESAFLGEYIEGKSFIKNKG